MLRLVLGALRRRVAQSVAVLVLTTLLCAVAAAGPQFVAAAAARTAAADLASAPPAQRLLSVRRSIPPDGDPAAALAAFRTEVEGLLPLRDAEPVLGLRQPFTVSTGGFGRTVPVAYRDGVCDRLRITGACPAQGSEVLLSRRASATLGIGAGQDLMVRTQPSAPELPLRVTGTYELLDPGGVYWADPLFGPGRIEAGEETLDPVFAARDTFAGVRFNGATAVYTTLVPPRLAAGPGSFADSLAETGYTLRSAGYELVTPGEELLGVIAADKAAVREGALAGWLQAIMLCWLALAVVGRHTAQDRRADVALLKLRGGTRRRIVHLAAGQHLAPMLAALPLGLLLGWLGARLAAGGPVPATEQAATLRLVTTAVAAAVAGGLGILALTELPALRTPVAVLLRRGPQRGSGRAGRILDLLLLALAGAALYQARSAGPSGLGAAAPALVALAVTILLARLVTGSAGRAGTAALRAGRLRAGLAALQFHRRPGIERIFALVAVAVALAGLAAQGYAAGRTARADRAAVEIGADRVLQVRAANRTALLWAVRQADPGGRTAMAVAVDTAATPAVLAADVRRLAAVTGAARDALDGAEGSFPAVDGTSLTLTARNDSPAPVRLVLSLEHTATGAVTTVPIGPLPPGEQEVSAPLPGCAQRPGCRILGMVLAGPADVDGAPEPAPAASALVVRGLRQDGPAGEVLDAARLGDPRFWRATTTGAGMSVAARDGVLTLRIPQPAKGQRAGDNHAWVVDSAQPVPVVLAGPAPEAWVDGDPALTMFGGLGVPVRVVGTVPLLPSLGASGVLVDLATAQRSLGAPGTSGDRLEVWLAGGTSRAEVAALTARLAAAGVEVTGADSVAARRDRLAGHGPALAARFGLLTAGAGLLLAAVAATVAVTAERRVRGQELRAMRHQGLAARDAAGAGFLGQAALLGVGLAGGLLAAVVAQRAVGAPVVAFIDDWRLLAPPDPSQPVALAAAGLVALAVLGAVSCGALLSWARTIRGAR
ncbi:FtsX-like permease family protein [Dactylosporangium sp. NPDC050588]|uniref:FtsX-like permease family protein n=1 Tax=Dactylosporangium sp. NPDC050588 TaxID=3157211 RepID=UPI0033DC2D91